MSDSGANGTDGWDTDRSTDGDGLHDAREGAAFVLHSVGGERGRDRCTVYPRRKRRRERTASWLSADHDAFVDLRDAR